MQNLLDQIRVDGVRLLSFWVDDMCFAILLLVSIFGRNATTH